MKKLPDNSGIALFLVLWVLVLLSVMAAEFCHTMKSEINIVRNFKEETQAYYIARAGMSMALNALTGNPMPVIAPDEEDEEETETERIKWRTGASIPPVPFADGEILVHIGNESGKVNINKANGRLLKMMLSPFELEEEQINIISESIQDWRDKDDLHRLNGAENKYYQSLPEPYHSKNGDFDSVEELLLVKGVTRNIFYGGLRDMVTVYPKNKAMDKVKAAALKKDAAGKKRAPDYNRININAAPLALLMALPHMDEETAMKIQVFRSKNEIKSIPQLAPVVGSEIYMAIFPYIAARSGPYYTVRSMGIIPETRIRREVSAIVKIDMKLKKKYRMIEWTDSMIYDQLDTGE